MKKREELIHCLTKESKTDVLIIGGGINGAGVFRDLAEQGIPVTLVDRGDFSSGASAASSHMIHGGIRYLENGEFGLVQEAVRERNLLLRNAAHAVRPLPTTVPIFKWFSGLLNAPLKFLGLLDKPAERGAIVIKVGMMLYDLYTRRSVAGAVPEHTFANRQKSLELYPDINPSVLFTGTYYDAMILMPERLTLELISDAENACQDARAINYMSAVGAEGSQVSLKDELTGSLYKIQPRIVINAAGPWIDLVNIGLGKPTKLIGGTKGSHLVMDHPELRKAIGDHEFFFENKDGRIVLIYPMLHRVMIGTSDIPIQNPDTAVCTDEEVDYFLDMVHRVFPNITVDRRHIVFSFSGVRPLPASKSALTGQISRDHSIEELPADAARHFPVYCLVGGKWTTFRAFAEQVSDRIIKELGATRVHSTANLPIGGGADYPLTPEQEADWLAQQNPGAKFSPERLKTLFERYGTNAARILQFISSAPDKALAERPDFTMQEILYLLQEERVVHLEDLLLRRTSVGMMGELTRPLLVELAAIAAESLGWTEETCEHEVQRTTDLLMRQHKIHL